MVWVLVVDDDAPTRETLRLALEDAGHAVLEAKDGRQALDMLRRSRRRLVALVDLLLPEMTGIDVLRLAAKERALTRRHRYIAMTAGGEELVTAVADTLVALSGELLLKPFGIDALLLAVAEAAARWPSARRVRAANPDPPG